MNCMKFLLLSCPRASVHFYVGHGFAFPAKAHLWTAQILILHHCFSQHAWHSLMLLVASITWSSSPSRWWKGLPAKTLTEPFLLQLGRVSLEAYR